MTTTTTGRRLSLHAFLLILLVLGVVALGILAAVVNFGQMSPVATEPSVVAESVPEVIEEPEARPVEAVGEGNTEPTDFLPSDKIWFASTVALLIVAVGYAATLLTKPVPAGAPAGTLPTPRLPKTPILIVTSLAAGVVLYWGWAGRVSTPWSFGPGPIDRFLDEIAAAFGIPTPPWWLDWAFWIGAISIVTAYFIGMRHVLKDGAPAVTKMAFKTITSGFVLMFISVIVLGPERTVDIIMAMRAAAQGIADQLSDNPQSILFWEGYTADELTSLGTIAFVLLVTSVFLRQLLKGHPWVVNSIVIVGVTGFFLIAFALAARWQTLDIRTIGDLPAAAAEAIESLPDILGGENQHVDLQRTARATETGVGLYDQLVISMPTVTEEQPWCPWVDVTASWREEHSLEGVNLAMEWTSRPGLSTATLVFADEMRTLLEARNIDSVDVTVWRERC
jgi:hypothetical protein